MCDAYTPAGEPIPTNKRHAAAEIFSNPDVVAEVPWLIPNSPVFSYCFSVSCGGSRTLTISG